MQPGHLIHHEPVETSITGARAWRIRYLSRDIAERVVRMFAQQTATAKLPLPVTLSAGVASLDEINVRSGTELLSRADDLLYKSKRSGKNLVCSASWRR